MQVKIYIANLSAYNSGRLVGDWIDLPADADKLQEIMDKHSYNGQHDIAIHDYEAPFEIGEYDNITDLNEFVEQLESMSTDEQLIEAMFDACDSRQEAMEVLKNGNFRVYDDCDNMEQVAMVYVEEAGFLSGIPEDVARYFDYESYGRDMEGQFHRYSIGGGKNNYVEIC